ncbi:MAG: hypothetical protein ACHREM_29150 [Polyangiales bacterium]
MREKQPEDLTAKEQAHVRAAINFLRFRFGTVRSLAAVLRVNNSTLKHVRVGRLVTPLIAFRVALLASVSIDELLAGRFPEAGTCPHCGRPGMQSTPVPPGQSIETA